MCVLVFSKPMERPFLRQKVNIHPCGHLRAGAGYNIIDAGGSGTKNYSSLRERYCILCLAQTSNRELLPLCTKPLLVNARSVYDLIALMPFQG